MSGETQPARAWRLGVLTVVGVVIVNVGAAVFFDRDEGLGLDEVVIVLIGVALALAVEYGVFRKRQDRA